MDKGLLVIGALRALRGTIALVAATTLYYMAQNLNGATLADHPMAQELLKKDSIMSLMAGWLSNLQSRQIYALALLAAIFSAVRWIEAFGIWFNRNWAKWMVLLFNIIYIPFEINELLHQVTAVMSLILVVNMLVVFYIAYVLFIKSKHASLT